MSDQDAFMRSIIENPDDDQIRLVFADWLEENGQPERAEFIRLQCKLAACEICNPEEADAWDWSCGHRPARRRERELLDVHKWDWMPPFLRVAAERAGSYRELAAGRLGWRRGFVESISCRWDGWLACAEEILAATPLREVTLATMPEPGDSVAVTEGYAVRMWGPDSKNYRAVAKTLRLGIKHCLEQIWPRIKTWHLPEQGRPNEATVTWNWVSGPGMTEADFAERYPNLAADPTYRRLFGPR